MKDSHLTKVSKQTEKQQVLSSPYLHYQFYTKEKENNLSNSFLLFFNTIDANKLVSQINSFVELNITKANEKKLIEMVYLYTNNSIPDMKFQVFFIPKFCNIDNALFA